MRRFLAMVVALCVALPRPAPAQMPQLHDVWLRADRGVTLGDSQTNLAGTCRYHAGVPQYSDGTIWHTFSTDQVDTAALSTWTNQVSLFTNATLASLADLSSWTNQVSLFTNATLASLADLSFWTNGMVGWTNGMTSWTNATQSWTSSVNARFDLYLPLAGGTVSGAVYSTSSSVSNPADNEFITYKTLANKLTEGTIQYLTTNITPVDFMGTNSAYTYESVNPLVDVTRTYSGLTNGIMLSHAITTNLYTIIRGPIIGSSYMMFQGGPPQPALSVMPSLYYTYDSTNLMWLADGDTKSIAQNVTNNYTWIIPFAQPSLTGSVKIVRCFHVASVHGTVPQLTVVSGDGHPTTISFTVPVTAPPAMFDVGTSNNAWFASNGVVFLNGLTSGWDLGSAQAAFASGLVVNLQSHTNDYYPRSNPSNWVDRTVTNGLQGAGAYLTVGSNVSSLINDSGYLTTASNVVFQAQTSGWTVTSHAGFLTAASNIITDIQSWSNLVQAWTGVVNSATASLSAADAAVSAVTNHFVLTNDMRVIYLSNTVTLFEGYRGNTNDTFEDQELITESHFQKVIAQLSSTDYYLCPSNNPTLPSANLKSLSEMVCPQFVLTNAALSVGTNYYSIFAQTNTIGITNITGGVKNELHVHALASFSGSASGTIGFQYLNITAGGAATNVLWTSDMYPLSDGGSTAPGYDPDGVSVASTVAATSFEAVRVIVVKSGGPTASCNLYCGTPWNSHYTRGQSFGAASGGITVEADPLAIRTNAAGFVVGVAGTNAITAAAGGGNVIDTLDATLTAGNVSTSAATLGGLTASNTYPSLKLSVSPTQYGYFIMSNSALQAVLNVFNVVTNVIPSYTPVTNSILEYFFNTTNSTDPVITDYAATNGHNGFIKPGTGTAPTRESVTNLPQQTYDYSFSGGQYIVATNADDLLNFSGSQAWSFGAWIYRAGGSAGFIAAKWYTAATRGWLIHNGDNLYLSIFGVGGYLQMHANGTTPANSWTFVCWTKTNNAVASGVTLYINGAASATTTDNDALSGDASSPSSVPVRFGVRGEYGSENGYYSGKLGWCAFATCKWDIATVTNIYHNTNPTNFLWAQGSYLTTTNYATNSAECIVWQSRQGPSGTTQSSNTWGAAGSVTVINGSVVLGAKPAGAAGSSLSLYTNSSGALYVSP